MPSGAPGGPQEDPIPNIPTVAIVDKENLRGQARRILGAKARPTVGGVVDGLARYGFGVREVHVSVALAKRKADEGKSEHRENAAFVARVEADRRGKLIKGLLQWDRTGGQPPKEKGVDVGIALAVVRQSLAIADGDSQFKAIALLCDDTDLAPAVDFAHELNVPCIVVGTDERLRYRGQPWCLLTDEVLAQVCAQRADLTGSALRARLANAVLNGTQLEEYEPDARGKGLARAGIGPDDPVGLPVLVPPGVDVRAVPRTPLTPTGIVWDRDKFPMITCADSTPLVEAKVVARLGDKLKVEIASAMVKVDAPR
ncbi:MAG: hypothetical protein QOE93_118, partial [Actinomycetota bacterium]|nr:hypothetical protein [Actinomycetota bacterium]